MTPDKAPRHDEGGFALLLALLLMMTASAIALTVTGAGNGALRDAGAGGGLIADQAAARGALAMAETRLLPVEGGRVPLADVAAFTVAFPGRAVDVTISLEDRRANVNHADLTVLTAAARDFGGSRAAAALVAWRGNDPHRAFWSFGDLALAEDLDDRALSVLVDRVTLDEAGADSVAGLGPLPLDRQPVAGGGAGRVYRLAIDIRRPEAKVPTRFIAVLRASGDRAHPWILHRLDSLPVRG